MTKRQGEYTSMETHEEMSLFKQELAYLMRGVQLADSLQLRLQDPSYLLNRGHALPGRSLQRTKHDGGTRTC